MRQHVIFSILIVFCVITCHVSAVDAVPVSLGKAAAASGVASMDNRQLRLNVGSLEMIRTSFRVERFSVSNKSIAKVEITGDNEVRVTGLRVGASDVQLLGDGHSATYRVTVMDDISELCLALKLDLNTIPEVKVTANRNKIVLQGEISNLEHWETLQEVLKHYPGNTLNIVRFRPAADVMAELKRQFEAAGFPIAKTHQNIEKGELFLSFSGNTMTVTGSVYSPSDLELIKTILSNKRWLTTDKVEDNKKAAIYGLLNVTVEPATLEIGSVYVGFDREDVEKIGYNFVANGIPFDFTGVYNWLINKPFNLSGQGGTFRIGSDLNTTLQMFGTNTKSYFKHAEYIVFQSNDTPQFRELHNGGTLKIKVNGVENGSLEDIQYGYILKVKGGLTGKNTVKLELAIELSNWKPLDDGYDLKTHKINTSITCKLDETIAIGGFKEMVDEEEGPAGLPYLRHIPVINWFVSESDTKKTEKNILVLISPRLLSQNRFQINPAEELKDLDNVVQKKLELAKKKGNSWIW